MRAESPYRHVFPRYQTRGSDWLTTGMNLHTQDLPAEAIPKSLRDQINAFKIKLNDFTRNNPLLFFRELKAGTLRLPDVGTPAIAKLLDGTAISVADIGAAGDVKTRAKLRDIHLKAQANAEERGLQTLFAGLGFATWTFSENSFSPPKAPKTDADGTIPKPLSPARNPLAPLVLLPVAIQNASSPNADPKIARAGDFQINAVLVAFVKETYGIDIDTEQIAEEAGDDLNVLVSRLRERLASLPDVIFPTQCEIGNFNFQKMAMVADLTEHIGLIAQNDLLSAISGDAQAQAFISNEQGRGTVPAHLDDIPAHDELFVLDADSSQQRVLHSILRSRTHAVMRGPPGTGKSQTIANLIAALIGDGKRVLFVAEKRAALDAVLKRLTKVGLGHLVLDLHGADVKRKKIYQGLQDADAVARSTPPPDLENTYRQFEGARQKLNAHDQAMHEKRPGYDQSLYELLVKYAKIPAPARCDIRLTPDQTKTFDKPRMTQLRALFDEAATAPALFLGDRATPWGPAEFPDDQTAERAVTLVGTLFDDLADTVPRIAQVARNLAVPTCTSLADLDGLAACLTATCSILERFEPQIMTLDVAALASVLDRQNAGTVSRFMAFFSAEARTAATTLTSAARGRQTTGNLRTALHDVLALPAPWRTANLFSVFATTDPKKLLATITRMLANLRVFAGIAKSNETQLSGLQTLVASYRETQPAAYKAVRAHALRGQLSAAGLSPIFREIVRAPRPPELWTDLFEGIWLRSAIERISIDDQRIAGFNRNQFEAVIAEFGQLDLDRLNLAAIRIRRSAAERYFQAQKDFPQQAVVFRTNLAKKIRQLPLRKLMEQADAITTALVPCWMASPLSVSQLTDPKSKFDVVIFDEASQVLPEDAITSIIRGKRVVLAGDKHQLPPTTFFAGSSETDDDQDDADATSDDNARNIESILDLMSIYVRPQSLDWHYRSRDERLIAFSNKEFYGNALITFPSREEPPPAIQHFLVEEPKRDGDEESNSAEVLRVVDLVLDHAEHRPFESLGVIAMGIKHATRIEKTLYAARQKRPELDAFFSDQGERTFFCKNLERVQGDERDAIILSIGYGKNLKGDMVYRFGPLNNAGGERRLNVAVSRAVRRMTLVSSFRSIDMDDTKLNATGAKLLKRYIRFAESDGRDLGNDQANDKIPMNEFEADIYQALSAKGLKLIPQYGTSSYRLDFAVQDPRAPGSYCLAIECDGATYHSAQTARDRDRIRQTHLEAQGWTFHHIWSTDWFTDRDGEITRTVAAYEAAIQGKLSENPHDAPPVMPTLPPAAATPPAHRTGIRPTIIPGAPIDSYTPLQLLSIVRWVISDGLLRSSDEILHQTSRELGYARVGAKIQRTLSLVIQNADIA